MLFRSNSVTFNTLTLPQYPTNTLLLVLDNSKTSGTLSQTLTNLTITAGEAPTLALNNATGSNLALIFSGTLTRPAGSELFLGTYTTPTGDSTMYGRSFATPNNTTARIDFTNFGTTPNIGVFFNTANGTKYAFRDTTGTAFMRDLNYSASGNKIGRAHV